MKRSAKTLILLLLTVALVLGVSAAAWAHACVVEELGGTYLQFSYSDETPMNGAKIIVKDSGGETIGTDKTSKEGIYSYEEFVGQAAVVVVNDGEGHMLEYEVPAEIPPVTDATPVPEEAAEAADAADDAADEAAGGMSGGAIGAIVAVVAAALIIALLFAKRGKKK